MIPDSIVFVMKTVTVADVARNFRVVKEGIENIREEIRLTRNRKTFARIVPKSAEQTALEVFGDLYRTLHHGTGDALARAVESADGAREPRCRPKI